VGADVVAALSIAPSAPDAPMRSMDRTTLDTSLPRRAAFAPIASSVDASEPFFSERDVRQPAARGPSSNHGPLSNAGALPSTLASTPVVEPVRTEENVIIDGTLSPLEIRALERPARREGGGPLSPVVPNVAPLSRNPSEVVWSPAPSETEAVAPPTPPPHPSPAPITPLPRASQKPAPVDGSVSAPAMRAAVENSSPRMSSARPSARPVPDVTVSIGHIEVRAAPAPQRRSEFRPRVSLSDFLRRSGSGHE
jgi:hypothetical protein